mmetsp:Transcript_19246/g.40328  ORF Transcript_19246/g.40328 Transcript_19246/m.40328 type:complete len:665 (+) Transcript_19246:48-2042(+)
MNRDQATSASSPATAWILVIAHPDDESMFFLPTLRNIVLDVPSNGSGRQPKDNVAVINNKPDFGTSTLTEDGGQNDVALKVLCLSNGDFGNEANGPIRTKELHEACKLIGVSARNSGAIAGRVGVDRLPSRNDVTVLDDVRMKDGFNEVWKSDVIAESILAHIQTNVVPEWVSSNKFRKMKKNPFLRGESEEIDQSWEYINRRKMRQSTVTKNRKGANNTIQLNLLTFDQGGVSGHPNHIDVFKGVRHLLNEKCLIEHDKHARVNDGEVTAKLRLTCNPKEGEEEVIELKIKVYTLNTISNPIYKYFFWSIMDFLPWVLLWIIRLLGYLLHFLLGGVLFALQPDDRSKSKSLSSTLPSFSGMFHKTSNSKSGMQCRIMDPVLVWNAMAAHHSQFVWYRRLSVLFSRYTYINDIVELPFDSTSIDFENDQQDMLMSLPPISVHPEVEKDSPEFLLSRKQMNDIRKLILPPSLHHRPWKRIYSLSRDGDSFISFQKLVGEWNAKGPGGHSTVLVVKSSQGEVFGGFTSVPFIDTVIFPSGSASGCCLFKAVVEETQIETEKEVGDKDDFETDENESCSIIVYGKNKHASPKRIVFDATRRIIAFGGGTVGGEDEGFGLCLEDGFAKGSTSRCEAFGNDPLVVRGEPGGLFDVLDVEVWGFVFGQLA